MKNKKFKVLLLITLLSGICFKANAMKETVLVKNDPTNNIARNEEITEFKENNGILTKTEKESKEDRGKIYNLTIKDTNNNSSTCEEKIYFNYILKYLEAEFNNKNKINLENIFKNLNVNKNNGNINIDFEVTIPNDKNISTKIAEFLVETLIPENIDATKSNLRKIINKYDLNKMKTDKENIIDKEIEKLNKYEKEIENEYKNENFFNNSMQSFFKMNNIFSDIEKMFDNSFFGDAMFNTFGNSDLDKIRAEVKNEEKEREKNNIKNKIEEKKTELRRLRSEKTNKENLNLLINNIKSLNSDGRYMKISKSISSISKNKN